LIRKPNLKILLYWRRIVPAKPNSSLFKFFFQFHSYFDTKFLFKNKWPFSSWNLEFSNSKKKAGASYLERKIEGELDLLSNLRYWWVCLPKKIPLKITPLKNLKPKKKIINVGFRSNSITNFIEMFLWKKSFMTDSLQNWILQINLKINALWKLINAGHGEN